MRNLLLLLLLSITSDAISQLQVVSDPDMPIQGWYWQPAESGWGLNCTIQEANFVPAGTFVFCAIFTYDNEGNPKWYTMSGEYVANSDVYAWRESRGPMGTFTSPLFESTGGSCPTCPHVAPTTSISSVGDMTIEWSDPLNATLTIAGVERPVVYQYYHAGLQANDADFITDGGWYIQGSIHTLGMKGFVKFKKLDLADTQSWTNDQNGLNLDNSFVWYESLDNPFIDIRSVNGEPVASPDADLRTEQNIESLLLAYNPANNKAHVFTATLPFGNTDVFIDVCQNGFTDTAAGFLNPAVASNTRLYFSEGVLDNCAPSTLSEDEKRQVFVSMTRIPQGGNDLGNLPAFKNQDF